ncbi:hypothetical protein T484DRAFT_1942543 [Baffinella frigidus]|nr:hypothetical protein T484DRAFT_1942543 [Cryptophyta sp. CCMP2293]
MWGHGFTWSFVLVLDLFKRSDLTGAGRWEWTGYPRSPTAPSSIPLDTSSPSRCGTHIITLPTRGYTSRATHLLG